MSGRSCAMSGRLPHCHCKRSEGICIKQSAVWEIAGAYSGRVAETATEESA